MASLQSMAIDVDEVTGGKNARIPQSRKDKLQAELKLLEWHKMANSAAIKGALLQTKATKTADHLTKPPEHTADDEKWIKRVIKQEHIRPLNVSKDFVLEYEKKERENADRLSNQVDRHITTLKTLRAKLESRHDLKARSDEFRHWQKDFLPKKQAVMIGKTIAEYEASKSKLRPAPDPDRFIDDQLMNGLQKGQQTSSQELSTVLDSLSRLADLEQRIAGLERENKYDRLMDTEHGAASQRSSIEFRKTRVPMVTSSDKGGPVLGIAYEIKNKKQRPNNNQGSNNWKIQLPTVAGAGASAVRGSKAGAGAGAGSARDKPEEDDDEEEEGDEGGNFFITAQGGHGHAQVDAQREASRRERARQLELASAGQKNLRTRLQDKRARAKEQLVGAKKHEAAMAELLKRKTESLKRGAAGKNVGIPAAAKNQRVAAPKRGAASGVRTQNKHLLEFEQMKSMYRKRKEDGDRKGMKGGGGKGKREDSDGGGEVKKRFVSQTAPAYDNRNHPYRAAAARVPATKTGGTVTRRTEGLPVRRVTNNSDGNDFQAKLSRIAPTTAPPIAVTGLSGLRVIQANRNNGNPRGGKAGQRR